MATSDIDILICEVGLRDGLQNAIGIMPTNIKKEWIEGLIASGIKEIEACSFVSSKFIKGMEDADEIVSFASAFNKITVAALAPNLFGVKNAMRAGVAKISLPVSVSEAHSHANVKKSRTEMITEVRLACEYRDSMEGPLRPSLEVGLSTAFGCGISGKIPEYETIKTAVQCVSAGVDGITLSDTSGVGNPAQVKSLFKAVKKEVGELLSGVHLHNTYGLGLANAYAAIEAGATTLDSSLGGLGGCPFAPGAAGNIVTEDLVFMLEQQGLRTGIDLNKLLKCRDIVKRGLPTDNLYGYLAGAGIPKYF